MPPTPPPHLLEVTAAGPGANQGLWRSAQPTTDDHWAYIRSLGIQRIVKLNTQAEGSDERAALFSLSVFERAIEPVSSGNIFQQLAGVFQVPPKSVVEDALSFMRHPMTLVHCTHGNDRTGLLCGIYRVRVCGWTKEQAWDEMIAQGYHPELCGLDAYWLENV